MDRLPLPPRDTCSQKWIAGRLSIRRVAMRKPSLPVFTAAAFALAALLLAGSLDAAQRGRARAGRGQDEGPQVVRAGSTPRESFAFRFTEPLTYEFTVAMNLDMDILAQGQNAQMSMEMTLRADAHLNPVGEDPAGGTVLELTLDDFEADMVMGLPGAGEILIQVRGQDVYGEAGGQVIIDTEQGIGQDAADEMLAELVGAYETGQITIDANGVMSNVQGSPEFEEFWQAQLDVQEGFFPLVVPTEEIGEGARWQLPSSSRYLGEIELDDDFTFTTSYSFVETDGGEAVFDIEAPGAIEDVTGTMSQGFQDVPLNIVRLSRDLAGSCRFDNERGLYVSGEISGPIEGAMEFTLGGVTADMELSGEASIEMRLVE